MTEKTSKMLVTWPSNLSTDECVKRMERKLKMIANGLSVSAFIRLKGTDAIVGWIDVSKKSVGSTSGEIAYWLGQGYQGNGYIEEVLISFCLFAKKYLILKRIIARTKQENTASQKILKKTGFALCGVGGDGLINYLLEI